MNIGGNERSVFRGTCPATLFDLLKSAGQIGSHEDGPICETPLARLRGVLRVALFRTTPDIHGFFRARVHWCTWPRGLAAGWHATTGEMPAAARRLTGSGLEFRTGEILARAVGGNAVLTHVRAAGRMRPRVLLAPLAVIQVMASHVAPDGARDAIRTGSHPASFVYRSGTISKFLTGKPRGRAWR